jgi:hypothetical protein
VLHAMWVKFTETRCQSGAEGIRTRDLRRAKALRAFRVRLGASACVA